MNVRAAVLLCVLIVGCTRGTVPAASMTVSISNSTTIPVSVVVNGTAIETLGAGSGAQIPASELPGLPWRVEARTSFGRVLLSLAMHDGDVAYTADGSKGVAARVDLSCGRIDLWSGPPLAGPMPGSGSPGDCSP